MGSVEVDTSWTIVSDGQIGQDNHGRSSWAIMCSDILQVLNVKSWAPLEPMAHDSLQKLMATSQNGSCFLCPCAYLWSPSPCELSPCASILSVSDAMKLA